MKILGHAYIATQALKGNNQLLIIGSLLPEMLPYIPNDIFEYTELHVGGKKLLKYLNKNYPGKRDLALGLLSHGYKFGADKYKKESELLVEQKREDLLKDIAQANSVSLEVAKIRLHNYVDLGIDWLLVQNKPKLVRQVQKTLRKINVKEISFFLAEAFGKDEAKVRLMVETLFQKIYRPEDLISAKGLARIWARQAAGLPEKDRVNVSKAFKIIQKCAYFLEKAGKDFLESTTKRVRKNLQIFQSQLEGV